VAATLSDILHGKAKLTPEMALRIEKRGSRSVCSLWGTVENRL
jgi:plasmid maintenance system antidote protein VapI